MSYVSDMPRSECAKPMIRETIAVEKSLREAIDDARRRTPAGQPVPSRAEMIRALLREALEAKTQIGSMQDFLCERGLFHEYVDWMESVLWRKRHQTKIQHQLPR